MKAISRLFETSSKQLAAVVVSGLVLGFLIGYAFLRDDVRSITRAQADRLNESGRIRKVIVDEPYLLLVTPQEVYRIYKEAVDAKAFFVKYPVEVRTRYRYGILDWALVMMLSVLFVMTVRRGSSNRSDREVRKVSAVSKEDTPAIVPMRSNVTFSDVGGIDEVKGDLEEILDFLRHPAKYKKMGVRLPKGVLLAGPPGVGKTMVAKALAGEANVPFFYHSGATFVNIYVGTGAKRVRELFMQAKRHAPSIVFIDEIDAVGKSRDGMRNDERETTLNQLLTEMDGFESGSGVMVIAATNKVEMLDEALLRPGRFDRRIFLSLPEPHEREQIVALHLRDKPHDVDIAQIARKTVGFSAAALETLCNEAALYALRSGKTRIETEDFEAVKDNVLFGKRKIVTYDEEERRILAYYQAAKALAATWLDIEFERIGIVEERFDMRDRHLISRTALLARIKVRLAGSVAVQLKFNERYSNAAEDLRHAKTLIRRIVVDYAMGEGFEEVSKEEAALMQRSLHETKVLIETIAKAIEDATNYLLEYESIDQEKCREILRALF